MTQNPSESPPFEGELYSEEWWQRVAPNLTPEGRALVHNTLTAAAAKLEAAAARLAGAEAAASQLAGVAKLLLIKKKRTKARAKFEETLQNLKRPSPEQLAFLADPERRFEQLKLTEFDQRDLSNILICDPETGEAIAWSSYVFPTNIPAVTFHAAIFVGKANFWESKFMGEAIFQEATFTGETNFDGTTFTSAAHFGKAIFAGKANFSMAKFTRKNGENTFWEAKFLGRATFEGATFAGAADFERAKFMEAAIFAGVRFDGQVNFAEAAFMRGEVTFSWAKFTGAATFSRAQFAGKADFQRATFADDIDFLGAQFRNAAFEAFFFRATFEKLANFERATFAGAASFKQAEFKGMAIFEGAGFFNAANFYTAHFNKTVSFRGSTWGAVPDFGGTAFKDGMAIADLESLQTALTDRTLDWRKESTPAAPITDRLQALRKMAHDADDRPRELDYFALELQSRYQAKKKIDDPTKNETWWLWLKQGLIWLYEWLWLKRLLIRLYGRFSDYGRGIGRPFWWLVVLWVGCGLGYTLLIKDAPQIDLWLCLAGWIGAAIELSRFDRRQKSNPNPKIHFLEVGLRCVLWGACVGIWGWLLWSIPQYGNAMLLSLVNALPALGVASEARKSSLEALYGCVECVPPAVHVIGVVEGVAAILLLFLIGLGLRNRFRL